MPREWRSLVDGFRDVQKLVHLAARMDQVDEDALAAELTKVRRRAYESELNIQLGRVGCGGRRGSLAAGPTLSDFAERAREDARGIVNTYNYDLAREIQKIASIIPPANRHTYAKRLNEWDEARARAKSAQIAQWTEGTARAQAVKDFISNNGLDGEARLEPRTAVCPVCGGWIKRGWIPIVELTANPPPYHPGCPHVAVTRYKKIRPEECAFLWVGE